MKKLFLLLVLSFGLATVQAQENPFAEYGYTPKVATLSQGQFNESFDNDTIVQIGSVLFNTKSKQIVAFVEYDTLYSEATLEPDIVSRWMSPDPLADHPNQIGLSPYQYGWNNPIYWTDPDGRCPLCPWIDAVVDVGFVVYDVGKLTYDKVTTGETKGEDWAALAADGASILVPMSTGAGMAARAAYKGVDKVMDAGKVIDKANDTRKAVDRANDTKKSGDKFNDVFQVTPDGVTIPKGKKYKIPENYVENPNRKASYGEYNDKGKFQEKLRIDPATPKGKKGPDYGHYHKDGKGTHYSPKPGDKDPGFQPKN